MPKRIRMRSLIRNKSLGSVIFLSNNEALKNQGLLFYSAPDRQAVQTEPSLLRVVDQLEQEKAELRYLQVGKIGQQMGVDSGDCIGDVGI